MAQYEREITVRLNDTDAAGVIYFANQLVLAHEVFEAFMDEIGCRLGGIFARGEYLLPIVRAEVDYLGHVRIGDKLKVGLVVSRLGDSSFTVDYALKDAKGADVGRCRMVHVAIDASGQGKIPLPDELRNALTPYCGD